VDQGDTRIDGIASTSSEYLTVYPDFTFIGIQNAGKYPHEGRFTSAVLTNDGVNLPRRDRQTDIVDSECAAEPLGYVIRLDQRRCSSTAHVISLDSQLTPSRIDLLVFCVSVH
jgi:hypothetical protein